MNLFAVKQIVFWSAGEGYVDLTDSSNTPKEYKALAQMPFLSWWKWYFCYIKWYFYYIKTLVFTFLKNFHQKKKKNTVTLPQPAALNLEWEAGRTIWNGASLGLDFLGHLRNRIWQHKWEAGVFLFVCFLGD